MKFILLSSLTIITFFNAFGQKCKFDKEDPFNNQKSITVALDVPSINRNNNELYGKIIKENDKFKVGLIYVFMNQIVTYQINLGDELNIKLANSETIKLESSGNYPPKHSGDADLQKSTFTPEYKIIKDDLELLKTQLITHVQVSVSDNKELFEISEKKAIKFKNAVNCIKE